MTKASTPTIRQPIDDGDAKTAGPIYVTRPLLPPLAEFLPYLEEIWESGWLTNAGPFHQRLEKALCEHLGVEHLALFANGTIALVTALQCLRISGQVITTPYSFVATSHSLLWNSVEPVFVDIDPATCNLDPERIEAAITPRTTAIMPVHCYGHPCDVDRIQAIADNYGLRGHLRRRPCVRRALPGRRASSPTAISRYSAFTPPRRSLRSRAARSSARTPKTRQRVDYLKNFGFADEVTVVAPGINGKMSEIHAAFGLLQASHRSLARQAARDRSALPGCMTRCCRHPLRPPAGIPHAITRTSRSSSSRTTP